MLQKVRQKIKEQNMIAKGDRVLVAVSGGADSVCLLMALCELQEELECELEVLHVEHGIRGAESQKDAEFVEALCRGLQLACYVVSVDVPEYSREQGLGTEEAARILRYEVLEEVAKVRDAKVALAHHMEDNAETILFQMVRGSGLTGLCGMQAVRTDGNGTVYLRPLLDVRREEIEAFLRQSAAQWREDSSNSEIDYSRNYLRHKVLPQLVEINTRAVEHINRTAAWLTEVQDYLEAEKARAKALVQSASVQSKEGKGLRLEALSTLHPVLQKEIIRDYVAEAAGSAKDITAVHVQQVFELCQKQSGREVHLPYGVVVRRDFDELVFSSGYECSNRAGKNVVNKDFGAGEDAKGLFERRISEADLQRLLSDGENEILEIPLIDPGEALLVRVFAYQGQNLKFLENPYTKWLDYDKMRQGFCIRTRKSGDYFISDVFGHHKKLKQYFVEQKISAAKRGDRWLLAQDSLVLWLIGGRISEHLKVTDETKYVVEITYQGGTQDGF